MTPNIEDYPGIIEAVQNDKLVLFVGNGVSRLLGYPSWEGMAENASKKLYDEQKGLRHIDFIEIELLKKLSPKKRLSIIKDICNTKKIEFNCQEFLKSNVSKNLDIYENLFSINTPFITTNYDDCLDKFTEKSSLNLNYGNQSTSEDITVPRQMKKVIYEKQEFTVAKLNPGTVIHLHGSIKDQHSMVMTTRDYIEHYAKDSFVDRFLEDLFNDYVVLFIGYGLEEEEILEYIIGRHQQESKHKESINEAKHYWLYPKLSIENAIFEHLKNYYIKHCNINLIDYNIDEKGHEFLKEIIYNWASKLKDKIHYRNFIDDQKKIDSII